MDRNKVSELARSALFVGILGAKRTRKIEDFSSLCP